VRRGERNAHRGRVRSGIESIAANPEFWRLGLLLSLERQPAELQARELLKEISGRVIGNRTSGLPELLAWFTMVTADGLFTGLRLPPPRRAPRRHTGCRCCPARLIEAG
jgi:hypothetical protein